MGIDLAKQQLRHFQALLNQKWQNLPESDKEKVYNKVQQLIVGGLHSALHSHNRTTTSTATAEDKGIRDDRIIFVVMALISIAAGVAFFPRQVLSNQQANLNLNASNNTLDNLNNSTFANNSIPNGSDEHKAEDLQQMIHALWIFWGVMMIVVSLCALLSPVIKNQRQKSHNEDARKVTSEVKLTEELTKFGKDIADIEKDFSTPSLEAAPVPKSASPKKAAAISASSSSSSQSLPSTIIETDRSRHTPRTSSGDSLSKRRGMK